MLVVSRKQDESIIIGNEIEIIVVRIDRNIVRLGVKAPRDISVHRKEVYEEIKAENIAATEMQVLEISTLQKVLGRKLKPKDPEKKADQE